MLVAGLGVVWFGAVAMAVADGRKRHWQLATIALLATAASLLAILLLRVLADGPLEMVAGGWDPGVGIRLYADALGAVFALISVLVVLFAMLTDTAARTCTRTTPAFALFLSTGLTGLFLTADIFSFFVFFELSMISAYGITATGEHRREVGAAFIFAVTNLLGSFLFLIAVAALYHVTGTLDMFQTAERLKGVGPESTLPIAVTFFVAFSTKLGLFPFHFWLPAIYIGSRPAVAAILSGALANIGAYGLLRFGAGIMPDDLASGAYVVAAIGVASLLYGSIQAFSRTGMAEVLAYSSIGQAGYVLVALSFGKAGVFAAIVFAIANALNKALLFLSLQLRGWVIAIAFAIGALSVAGVPPTAGFFGKMVVLQAAVEDGSVTLVLLLLLGAALSFLYMFRSYQLAFWKNGGADEAPGSWAVQAPVVVLALLIVGLGVWPEPLLHVAEQAAVSLGATP